MKITFHKGSVTKKNLLNAYYLHPTLKYQPYKPNGFELVLWFWSWFVSIRIIKKL